MAIPVFREDLLLPGRGSLNRPAIMGEKEMPVVVIMFTDPEKGMAIPDSTCSIPGLELPVPAFVVTIGEQGVGMSALIIQLFSKEMRIPESKIGVPVFITAMPVQKAKAILRLLINVN